MSLVLTPAALSFSMTSRTISKEEWAFGLAVGNDLDADDVAGLEEVLPGFDGVGGAGQLFHAAIKRGLDCGGVAVAARCTSPGCAPRRPGRDKARAPRAW